MSYSFGTQTPLIPAPNYYDENGQLLRPEMCPLPCKMKVRIFEPCEEYRDACLSILVTISGEHPHPIPLTQETPPVIRSKIFQLLKRLHEDLPDPTLRKFLRQPIVKSFLRQCFPDSRHIPTLLDLHVSGESSTFGFIHHPSKSYSFSCWNKVGRPA